MPGVDWIGKGRDEKGQQQRIRASRLRDEAPSGFRNVFCVTMLCLHEKYHFAIQMSTRGFFALTGMGVCFTGVEAD